MRNYKPLVMLFGAAVVLAACEKNAAQDITEPPPGGAAVKFFNFSVGGPPVDFFANDEKLTGVSATNGTTYGGAGTGGWYDDIAPGQYTFKAGVVPTGEVVATATATVAAQKYYSFYLSGQYDATLKKTDSFVIEDVLPAWDYTNTYVRFVNTIYNATPLTLYAKNTATGTEVAIGGATAYKAGTTFVSLPPGSYNLRASTGTTDLITRAAVTFGAQRVYTISARGDVNTASTRALDNTANR